MKLYIDDLRSPSGSWMVARTYNDAIAALDAFWNKIEEISVDHDLSEDKTGYDIAKYIEWQIEVNGRKPIPKMYTHSANPAGSKNINAVFNKYKE